MATYKVKSADTTEFTLLQNEQYIGRLKYKNWFSFKAEITIENDIILQVEPVGFEDTVIEIRDRDQVLLDFKMNWKGRILIHSKLGDTAQYYTLKQKGFFRSAFVLTDSDGLELLILEPDFKWNHLNYDYDINSSDVFEENENKNILILTAIHCSNYFITTMTTAGDA